jgi:hypothetical protein
MNEEEFKKQYKYRSWEWPSVGDKVRFENAEGILERIYFEYRKE